MSTTGKKVLGLLVVGASLFAGCASAPPEKPAGLRNGDYGWFRDYMTWAIENEVNGKNITGLSIAVVDDQEVVWQRGFGFADKERKLAADADTVYSAGSISKLFTATAAMHLVERGRLDLDRPVGEYLPEFAIQTPFVGAGPVTMRGLLTHHAGMPSDRYHEFILSQDIPEDEVEARFQRLPGQLDDAWLARPPGTAFSYSNLGFSVAGTTLARVSGKGFAELVRDSVLVPAGMVNSSFRRSDVAGRLAKGYFGGKEVALPNLRDVPAGGLLTSAADLAQFIKVVFAEGRGPRGQVLQPASLAEMLRAQNESVPLDLDFRIGLAWWLDGPEDRAMGRMAARGGDLPPFHAALITLPDTKLGVVILSNSEESGEAVMKLAFEAARRAVEAKTGVLPPERKARPVERSAEELNRHTGAYANFTGVTRVERSGNGLRTEFSGTPLHLVPTDDGRFSLEYRLLGLMTLPVDQLTAMSVSYHEVDGRKLQAMRFGPVLIDVAERVEPQPELSAAWKARLGRYQVTNVSGPEVFGEPELVWEETTRQLVLKGKLVLTRTMNVGVAAAPVSDTEAVTLGVGRNSGELLRCPDADTCFFSGFELRRRR